VLMMVDGEPKDNITINSNIDKLQGPGYTVPKNWSLFCPLSQEKHLTRRSRKSAVGQLSHEGHIALLFFSNLGYFKSSEFRAPIRDNNMIFFPMHWPPTTAM